MHYLVYKIIQLSTGREYIGQHQTTNLNDGYMGSGTLITAAVQDNPSDFVKVVVRYCTSQEEMNELESALVTEEYLTENFPEKTFNQVPGGAVDIGTVAKWQRILNPKYRSRLRNTKRDPNWVHPKKSGIPAKLRGKFRNWKSKAKGDYSGFEKWATKQIREGVLPEWIETFRNSLNPVVK